MARILPKSLPADSAFNTSGVQINILDPVAGEFDAIEGTYRAIRKRTQELHAQHGRDVDLWIHLGRGPWTFVTCERLAFRQDFGSTWLGDGYQDGYFVYRDNAGETAHEIGPCPWTKVPMGLNSEIDVEAVVPDANASLKRHTETVSGADTPLEVRSHLEAGGAGCGFIFYESMANCFVAGRGRDVLFTHLPRNIDEKNLEKARDAVLAIIGASCAAIAHREDAPPDVDWKEKFGHFR